MGKLGFVNCRNRAVMKNLIGQSFSLADGHYRIVDVRRLGGDAMVYAERTESAGDADDTSTGARRLPGRTAFRYGDIASLLQAPQQA